MEDEKQRCRRLTKNMGAAPPFLGLADLTGLMNAGTHAAAPRTPGPGGIVRIALRHRYYSSSFPSGENVVVDLQVEALRVAGADVLTVSGRADDASSTDGARGSRIRQYEAPIAAKLHKLRTVCSTGTPWRDGHDFEECLAHSSFRAMLHSRYRGSPFAMATLSSATRDRGRTNPTPQQATALIVLAPRSKGAFLRRMPDLKDRLRTGPNLELDSSVTTAPKRDAPWIFVGPLPTEKGFDRLIAHWPVSARLIVVGSGPLDKHLRLAAGAKPIEFIGQVAGNEITKLLDHGKSLVFPSRWRESAAAMAYVDAPAVDRPTLAIGDNAVADDVATSGAGAVISDSPDLVERMAALSARMSDASLAPRRRFDAQFSEPSRMRVANLRKRCSIDMAANTKRRSGASTARRGRARTVARDPNRLCPGPNEYFAAKLAARLVGAPPLQVTTLDHTVAWIVGVATESHHPLNLRFLREGNISFARKDSEYRNLSTQRGLNFPEGMTVVWAMNSRYVASPHAGRVRGPTVIDNVIAGGVKLGIRHYLIGASPAALEQLVRRLPQDYADVQIVGHYSPSYARVTPEYGGECAQHIAPCRPDIVWFGLGTPKRGAVGTKLADILGLKVLNVGAAFDLAVGAVREAPAWIRTSGFEWEFRLISEPRRLWRRYLIGNVEFLVAIIAEYARDCEKSARPNAHTLSP